jgi:pimeloyl-ACP methyl ester carboxylesterase
MIAHAYTVQFPNDVASIAWGECPLPGTDFYHETKSSMPVFHFTFHAVPDLPELLVAGKERIYLKHFFDRLAQNPASISTHDLDVYATEYAQPGAMRAGMNCYRTFEQDGEDNNAWVRNSGKCPVRCLALWGAESFSDEKASTAMCDSFYENVSFHAVPGAGHWIAEEKPAEFVDALVKWFGRD